MDATGRGASDWLANKQDYPFSIYQADAAVLMAGLSTRANSPKSRRTVASFASGLAVLVPVWPNLYHHADAMRLRVACCRCESRWQALQVVDNISSAFLRPGS